MGRLVIAAEDVRRLDELLARREQAQRALRDVEEHLARARGVQPTYDTPRKRATLVVWWARCRTALACAEETLAAAAADYASQLGPEAQLGMPSATIVDPALPDVPVLVARPVTPQPVPDGTLDPQLLMARGNVADAVQAEQARAAASDAAARGYVARQHERHGG